MNKRAFFFLSVAFCFMASAQNKPDTLRLFYEINEFQSEKNNGRIDSLFSALSGKFIKIKILGYADYLHAPKYNLSLSQKRADAVKNYVQKKAAPSQITSLTTKALGEKFSKGGASPKGEPFQRRVDLVIEPFVIVEHYDDQPKKRERGDTTQITRKIENLEKGESLAIEGLNFEPGRHMLVKGALPVLEQLLNTLKDNPKLKIEIQGHICCVVGEEDGMDVDTHERKLSYNRAQAVYNYLVKNGIKSGRLTYQGFGRSKPKVFPEKTEADEQANRRVEILVVDK
jgi:outer membrane protein OmpA-like peptidoglycan-associated protein